MGTHGSTKFDADELFKLGLMEMEKGNHDKAIGYLKEAHEMVPDNGSVLYLLAAEHAQIGLYERAVEEMEKALELQPDMVTARFQLGLLLLTSGQRAKAETAWQPLKELGDEHYLNNFAEGMLAYDAGDSATAKNALNRGLLANQENAALNHDMQRFLSNRLSGDHETEAEEEKDANVVSHHKFLSAYEKDEED